MTASYPSIDDSNRSLDGPLHARLRAWWSRYQRIVLRVLVVLMTLSTAWRLNMETRRLVSGYDRRSAIDLRHRYEETIDWFSHRTFVARTGGGALGVYDYYDDAVYPPATYAILWPLIGWVSLAEARWIWAAATLVAVAGLGWIAMRETAAPLPEQRHALFILPFAMYATAATLSTGQLIVILLPLLLCGLLLASRSNRIPIELLAAAMLVIGLAKLTIALPFMWIVLLASRSYRPAIFVCMLYALLTLFAAHFQYAPLSTLIRQWLANGRHEMHGDYGNLHSWFTAIGLERFTAVASPLAGLLLGAWVWFYRRVDVWILIGVAALFARMWTYHRLYDDLLALPAIIALFRLARGSEPERGDVAAGLVLAMMILLALAPAGRLDDPGILGMISRFTQTAVWLIGLAFLIFRAAQMRTSEVTT